MKRLLLLALFVSFRLCVFSQSFELSNLQDSYKGSIGEVIKAPLRIKNTSDKPITIIIRKISEQIGSTQHNYFCNDGNCLENKTDEFIIRMEPGQVLNHFQVALEAGLVPGISSIKYLAFNRFNPHQAIEFELHFTVDEKAAKQNIYHSRFITLLDVYPNPANDYAFVDYKMTSDRVTAKIRVHNILGNVVGEYDLSPQEDKTRIKTDELNAGIYFYTLYVDNESVMTRKLIVKK